MNTIKLGADDFDSFNDILLNVFDKDDFSNEEIYSYWETIPNDLKLDSEKYGVSDTPTRESIYLFLKKLK